MRTVLASSRYFIAAAVLGTFLSSVILIISGILAVLEIAWDQISDREIGVQSTKAISFEFLELIDIFLLGTALYVIALGLYQLFVDQDLPLPPWLVISDFDVLKQRLIGVVIVLLGVSFLGVAVHWQGGKDIAYLGAGTGFVVLALSVALYLTHRAELEMRASQPGPASKTASEGDHHA